GRARLGRSRPRRPHATGQLRSRNGLHVRASRVGRRWLMVVFAVAAGVLAAAFVGGPGVARASGPTDDYFWDHQPVQWGLLQVGAPAAWTASTGSGAIVGIVHSGGDDTHE